MDQPRLIVAIGDFVNRKIDHVCTSQVFLGDRLKV